MHPGYGYLSENADFADQVRQAGLIFIGPSAQAMSTLGDKRSSKEYLLKHAEEVPLVPGFSGSSQDVTDLEAAATKIGFPVMLKASAGGGGKGMRIVHKASQLRSELERAQSEAKRSFGSSDCILEKFVTASKHVEMQILGDRYGTVVCLGERDCSVQRRHQKIIEETPCHWLTPALRQRMSRVAVRIGELIKYEGAGTVEFIVDVKASTFYFLEVNARLQVEHPITEEVTGVDIVSLQLYVAAGGQLSTLPFLQRISPTGHAIECRLCAEDPNRDFFPEHGVIRLWQQASDAAAEDVRYETAVSTGTPVSIYFDAMIAKIVVWAPSRDLAIEKMVYVLRNTVCAGVRTNQLFLQSCLYHKAFRKDPGYTTSFIPQNLEVLLRNPHTTNLEEKQRELSMITALYARYARNKALEASGAGCFRHVRTGFRNQRLDPVNRHSDIISIHEPGQQAKASTERQPSLLCVWKQTSSAVTDIYHLDVARVPLSQQKPSAPNEEEAETSASKVTAAYKTISNILRGGDLGRNTSYELALNGCVDRTHALTPGSLWNSASIDVTINGKRTRSWIVTTASLSAGMDRAKPDQLFVHSPTLGTWMACWLYSPLSYCESLREQSGGSSAVAMRDIKAPMPCKVLQVLKRVGEDVKVNDSVMIIESMKMEINISANVEGRFQTSLHAGDTVDEGTLLCTVASK